MKITLCIFVLFIIFHSNLVAQTNTTGAGRWETGGNWDNGVPGVGNPATVLHAMIIDVTTGNLSGIPSIIITNTTAVASLTISGGVTVAVDGDVSLTAVDGVNVPLLTISGDGTTLTIGGDLNYTANNATGDNDAIGSGFDEITMTNGSFLTASNLTLEATNCPTTGSSSGLDLILSSTSSMDIAGTTTLIYNTTNQNTQYEINIIVDDDASFETTDLIMDCQSSSGSNNNNNVVRTDAGSASGASFTILNNISFITAEFDNVLVQSPAHNTSSVNSIRPWGDGRIIWGGTDSYNEHYTNPPSAWTFFNSSDVSQDGTLELNGTGDQTVPIFRENNTATVIGDVNTLIINKASGTCTLGKTILVHDALILTDGILDTDIYDLTINNADATATSTATSFVDGPVKKLGSTAFIFPIGNGTTWAPIEIGATDAADELTEFTAQYTFQEAGTPDYEDIKDSDGITNVSWGEFWNLTTTGTNFTDVDVTLHWKSATASEISTYGDLRVAHYDINTEWENLGVGAISATDPGDITVNISFGLNDGVDNFGNFTFGSIDLANNTLLPIELVDFYGLSKNNRNQLHWSTASETDNEYFVLERSANGVDFERLGKVQGAGTSSEQNDYSFTDGAPFSLISYYRLQQVDFDGTATYSHVIAVESSKKALVNNIFIYPNPFGTNEVDLTIALLSPVEVNDLHSIQLINAKGQVVKEFNIFDSNKQSISLDMQDVPAAIYTVKLIGSQKVYTKILFVE